MISKIIRIIIGLLGAAFGTAVYITLVELLPGLFTNVNNYKYIIAIGAALAFGIIFYIKIIVTSRKYFPYYDY